MTEFHEPRSRTRRRVMNGLLIFLVGVFIARLPATLAQITGRGEFLDTVNEVYQAILATAVEPPEATKLQRGAIDGMLEALNDDYAEFIPEEDAAMFEKEMTGQFSGIGCQIEIRDGWLTVVSPLEDSPAFNAGIMANDRITKIGDKSTFGLSSDECIKLLTGPPGTEVTFTVQRDGAETPYTLTRAPIASKSVRGIERLNDGSGKWRYLIDAEKRIAYIRLSQFTPTAAAEVAEALEAAARQAHDAGGDLGGIILDLRNNPGGIMECALAIADMFIESGKLMSIRGRNAPETIFNAELDGTLPDIPTAVIVNEASASASEIVAGAIRDHNRGIVVGTRTFGKGLVQSVARLRHSPKAQVKFTTARYYLPSGRLIQRTDDSSEWGVDPTPGFYVPMSDREQYEAFLKRREWDILRRQHEERTAAPLDEHHWSDPEWIRTRALDKQLAAAVEAVRHRAASSEWQPVSDTSDQHGKLLVAELKELQKARRQLGLEFARIEKRMVALQRQADNGETATEQVDLWSDGLDPTGGRVEVVDKEGRTIAKLEVTGRDLERWLLNADVKPIAEPGSAP